MSKLRQRELVDELFSIVNTDDSTNNQWNLLYDIFRMVICTNSNIEF